MGIVYTAMIGSGSTATAWMQKMGNIARGLLSLRRQA